MPRLRTCSILLAHGSRKRKAAALTVLPPQLSGHLGGLLSSKNASRSCWNWAEAIFFLCASLNLTDPIRV